MFRILRYKSIDSTNSKAKRLLIKNSVILSEIQTAARGRFGRKWHSGSGGLWFSVTIKERKLLNPKFLTFIAAIAMHDAIKKVTGIAAPIKWPNDLLFDKKKLCGILTESVLGKENYFIIGIGLNVNNTLPLAVKNKATTLYYQLKLSGQKNVKMIDKEAILKIFLKEFESCLGIYKRKQYDKILSAWKKRSDNIGKKAKVITLSNKTYQGIIKSIDKEGNLLLKVKNDIIKVEEADLFL